MIAVLALLPAVTAAPQPEDNPVLFWNNELINATRLSRNPPPIAALHFATYHLAIFETINSFDPKYQPWLVSERAPEGASLTAAVAAAAYLCLDELWKQRANPYNFESAYQRALAAVPNDSARNLGLDWGRTVARAVLDERAKHPVPPPEHSYAAQDQGVWRETPPGFRPAIAPRLGEVKPYALRSSSQFRAPPPPPLDSEEYAEELEMVKRIGPRDAAERDEYQTLSAPFWADDIGSATPAGHWNLIAQDITRRQKLSVPETARLFALLNIAAADAGITCWETKYYYRTWRPETAIRESLPTTNPHLQTNPDFIPSMASPAFPSYTSGHSTYTAAMTRMIERFFDSDDIAFTTTSDGLPGAVRSYERLSDARREVGMSRIWGGIHVMSDNIEGQKAGIAVADWIFENALRPIDP